MRPTTTPSAGRDGKALRTIGLPLASEEIDAIDDVRFGKRFATRAEAIRHILKKGLEAERNERT